MTAIEIPRPFLKILSPYFVFVGYEKPPMLILFTLQTVSAASSDCLQIISLAQSLNMGSANPSTMSNIQANCCGPVPCDGNGRVTQISWSNLGLFGTFDGSQIPPFVTFLDLSNNAITGRIPNNLPSNVATLYLSTNQMSGDLPIFPASITAIRINGNHLSGTLTLDSPTELFVMGNYIANIIISDNRQLTGCDFSNNPLLGNPVVTALSMCIGNQLYSAAVLPNTMPTTTNAKTTKLATTTTRIPTTTSTVTTTTMTGLLKSSTMLSSLKTASSNSHTTSSSFSLNLSTRSLNLNFISTDLTFSSESKIEQISFVSGITTTTRISIHSLI